MGKENDRRALIPKMEWLDTNLQQIEGLLLSIRDQALKGNPFIQSLKIKFVSQERMFLKNHWALGKYCYNTTFFKEKNTFHNYDSNKNANENTATGQEK